MNKLIMTTVIALVHLTVNAPAFAGDGMYVSGGINTTSQTSFSSRNTGTNEPNTGAEGGVATLEELDYTTIRTGLRFSF